jgi:hypothetical protein
MYYLHFINIIQSNIDMDEIPDEIPGAIPDKIHYPGLLSPKYTEDITILNTALKFGD